MKIFKTAKSTELPISDIKGKDYLEVKWRIVWFREERPTWSIETDFCSVSDKEAFCKAIIRDESGRVICTSHKFEDKAGFPDFREKAETGSIGRALALIGYGTQFCADELDEGKRLADSPVSRANQKIYPSPEQPGEGNGNTTPTGYRIGFGKWRDRTIEQVYDELGPQQIDSYIRYLEDTSAKKGKPLGAEALDFIERASEYLGKIENTPPDEAERF